MNLHPNITAYQGVESLSRFNESSFLDYCRAKLKICDKHIDFIRSNCMNGKAAIDVLEIGSGSGKLLFRLEQEGLLNYGVGYELSASRVAFSEKFAEFCKSKRVESINADFLDASIKRHSFDLIIGIDVVYNLIGGTDQTFEDVCLAKAASLLVPGGCLVLEIMTCSRELSFIANSEDRHYRPWKMFDETNPFQFGLDDMSIDHSGNLVWSKKFIDRKGEVSEFTNVLRPYAEKDIQSLLLKHGFHSTIFQNWALDDDTSDQKFIVLARKEN